MSQSPGFSVAEPGKWVVQPEADALVQGIVADALARCPQAADFSARVLADTGIRLIDILDHVVVPDSHNLR